MNRKVYLDGELGAKFGSEFEIYAKSFSDIMRCLNTNFPELREYLLECHEKNIGFLCQVGDEGLQDEEELFLSLGEGDVYISPQPAGSKSGLGKILAAIALVVVAIYAPQLLATYTGSIAGTSVTVAGSLGTALAGTLGVGWQIAAFALIGTAVNLALTGIQQIMAPDPSVDGPEREGDSSYLFRGAEQTILEGDPVPVVYGQLRVPGRPIGFEIRNKKNTFSNTYGGPGGGYGPFGWGYYYNFHQR